jgi:16S rRNA (cytosine1402-N4)-methyltransferase
MMAGRGRNSPAVGGPARHIPVMLSEVLASLEPKDGDTIVDGTFGAGGYSQAILDHADCKVIAIDRDPEAFRLGRALVEAYPGRLVVVHARFSEMQEVAAHEAVGAVGGVVLDLGVSSMQLDQAERGFAFSVDGPLDMRMERAGESAADFLNTAAEADIADVLYRYGEERQSRRVARAIVAARPLTTTGQLAGVVRKALGYRAGAPKDPATRSFQAVRIHVNRELEELEAGLSAAEAVLSPGGRLAVVSFHSLEDRIVKQFLREASGGIAGGSRHLPPASGSARPSFTRVSKAIRASAAELARNPRARSATLRHALRTDATPRQRRAA